MSRRNPEGLTNEAGRTLLASAAGVAGAVALEAGVNGLKKGAGADNVAAFSNNATAAIVGGVGTAIGLALHARDTAPRVGKALIAASVALAGARFIAHRNHVEAQRVAGSRGSFRVSRLRVILRTSELEPFSIRIDGVTAPNSAYTVSYNRVGPAIDVTANFEQLSPGLHGIAVVIGEKLSQTLTVKVGGYSTTVVNFIDRPPSVTHIATPTLPTSNEAAVRARLLETSQRLSLKGHR